MASDLVERLRQWSDCYGVQVSAELKEAATRIERLEAALREIMGMDEVAIVEFKKGDGWLHQRVARAALEGK